MNIEEQVSYLMRGTEYGDEELKEAMKYFAKLEGIMLAPEAAATVIAVDKLKKSEFVNKSEKIILFGTGSGLTTPEMWIG